MTVTRWAISRSPQPSANRDAKGITPNSRGPDIKEIETAMRFDGGR
jgi:hypothetical protein